MKKRAFSLLAVLFLLVLTACASSLKPYTITQNDRLYQIDPVDQTLSCGRYTYRYAVDGDTITVTYPNGNIYTHTRVPGGSSGLSSYSNGSGSFRPYDPGDELVNVLSWERNRLGAPKYSAGKVLLCLLIAAAGLLSLISPRRSFRLAASLLSKNPPEPSGGALTFTRTAGGVLLLLALLLLFIL